MFQSKYVVVCAFFVCIGGFLFGYDQGVISIVLVMDQFEERFPEVSATASGAGFWKGLMTAMIELGAFIGMLLAGESSTPLGLSRTVLTHTSHQAPSTTAGSPTGSRASTPSS